MKILTREKNGFTMVELLAVIVILAVVTLIAVTNVLPRMNNAKKKAFQDEALIYIKAGKEAYTTDQSTECYNIGDFGNYIKQEKPDYSGTLFVSDDVVTVHLTNGKYYIITDGNIDKNQIVETKPENFVTSCSDTSKTFTLSYDLKGGTLAEDNPSSYNYNTSTITLNNPTKPGYAFKGWSSKNIMNVNLDSRKVNGITSYVINNELSINGTNTRPDTTYTLDVFPGFINLEPGKTYTLSVTGDLSQSFYNFLYRNKSGINGVISGVGSTTTSKTFTTPSNYDYFLYSYFGMLKDVQSINTKVKLQLEEGSTATEYQEYMNPTKTVKIYRGSNGDRKYVANWGKSDHTAEIGNQYFDTVADAVASINTSEQVLIKVVDDSVESITIDKGKNVIIDLQNNTIQSAFYYKSTITNNGTLKVMNGHLTSYAEAAVINNNSTSVLEVVNVNIEALGNRQAIYNDGGTATISGNSILSAKATERAALQNQATGTVTVLGGSIISTGENGIRNLGTMTLGAEGGGINNSSPLVMGVSYAVHNTGTLNYYDGVLKGIQGVVNGSITAKQEPSTPVNTTESINGDTYNVEYLN